MGVGHIRRLLLIATLPLALAACGGASFAIEASEAEAEATPEPLSSAGVIPAESLRWSVAVRGVRIAEMSLSARPVATRQARTRIASSLRSTGVGRWFRKVSSHTITVADASLPTSAWADRRAAGEWHRLFTRYAAGRADVITEHPAGSEVVRRRTLLGREIFNADTALYALRHWRADAGDIREAVGLAETRLWWMRFVAHPVTEVKVRGRRHRATPITGRLWRMGPDGTVERRPPRVITVWLSADEHRLPLRIDAETKFGVVRVELVESSRPDHRAPFAKL